MKPVKTFLFVICLLCYEHAFSQEGEHTPSVGLFIGAMNYQGDLNPSSFKFSHSGYAAGFIFRKPFSRWFALRAGLHLGKIQAADRWNRNYLQTRNLSYYTALQEAHLALEISILDLAAKRFTPYMYGGVTAFHYNPWTYDNNGNKVFLKPLSTEGQGIAAYPDRKPYKLTQFALAFGGGARVAVSDGLTLGIELNQRKTFTDYLDDVSSSYVDGNVLLQERGAKAVELAYRGDEVPNGITQFPGHGDQRGTPSEMDWYYYFGVTMEFKLTTFGSLFQASSKRDLYSQRCPKNVMY